MQKPVFNRTRFKKVLRSKTNYRLKNDESDLLVYVVYLDYLSKLIKRSQEKQEEIGSSELSTIHMDQVNNILMKEYRG